MTRGLIFLAIGTEIVILTIGGYFLGQLLDSHLGTQPWMVVVCVLLGAIIGFYQLFALARRFVK
jgi:F0F1-type ATP synthase assembly protein I